ncbi:hypothetical protein GQ53DRAFT_844539 [Thozetella sp. PMI_491]|nr:hypothetical protein GQ53DRAFT_844539 [Thozetella sp. PMI_491]
MNSSAAEMPLFEPQAPARRRPLRTYGRRSVASDREESESPRKKRRVEAPITPTSPPKETVKENALPPLPPPKRGSILAFFQPVPLSSSSRVELSSEPPAMSSEAALPMSTPPSSPPPPLKTRKRRRLTTRPALDEEDGARGESEERSCADVGSEREASEETAPAPSASKQPGESAPPHNDSLAPREAGRSALSELLANALAARAASATMDEGKKEKKARRKPRKKELVQTTLSLSMNPGPGFTICKTCGLLYNHLNEKDRKDHARWHAGRNKVQLKLEE